MMLAESNCCTAAVLLKIPAQKVLTIKWLNNSKDALMKIYFYIYSLRKLENIQERRIISYAKYIEDIQIFGMNMPFISSSEAKNAYFMSGEATNEIYIFSLHEMK